MNTQLIVNVHFTLTKTNGKEEESSQKGYKNCSRDFYYMIDLRACNDEVGGDMETGS